MKLNFIGDTTELAEGIKILEKELHFEQSTKGFPIYITNRAGSIEVNCEQDHGVIKYEEKIHFFRALGLWLENYQTMENFHLVEDPKFSMTGVMLDSSRNAVLTVNGIYSMLRKMAVMGLNVLMVYTEDTYEVKEYPYFGYMRGRYTEEELRNCDQYASKLGIEMIPCIQTLAHLTEALKWNYAAGIRDTADILLVDNPDTYTFIEHLIRASSSPFQSKRIHIGMDEAHQLGLGKYLEQNGYEERFNIMNRHLQKVVSITEKMNLKPMIWSDMYFRLGLKTGGYYDLDAVVPQEVMESIPDTQLVYWDYYHTDEEFYRTFIRKHQDLGSTPVFAGGVWIWNGISPNYGKALATTEAALTACKKEGVQEVFATMWGDNGAETPLTTSLPVLQYFAEHAYHEKVTKEQLEKRFYYCTGGNFSDFMILNKFDETPGVSKNNLHESNPSKFLLWQDPLIGLYDENIKGLELNSHYQNLISQLDTVQQQSSNEWSEMFAFYQQLAVVLSSKAELGIQIKHAYDNKEKGVLNQLVKQITLLRDNVNTLRKSHRTLWFNMYKAFGWEVLEIRYGGLIARLETTEYRLQEWLVGKVTRIEELEEERLPFEGPYPMPKVSLGRNIYRRIVTASNLT
ncbi:beta-N-acetylhexosaminidase [Ornithinibacillus halotolerans]|uniref:Benzene 1,2-dioxygenase n=1 Tax=Ornithinibacillus halotolerans TaxID=1274357 RepID=A0A916RTJ3_9BACI|nr:beta-N-acetylhexosaminidase [Ornithinibacillus halotolerans]GGA66634.1 benzene 1,2-dioxygenase [Ornithinibacillus halotolerans]